MSVAATRTSSPMNATLQENARVFPIGVSTYDAWPDRPVRSATANALAWLVVALRMGVTPYGNPLLVEEAIEPELLVGRLRQVIEQADMDESERHGLQELVADVKQKDEMGWQVGRPVYAAILQNLLLVGNHLEWNKACRLLVTYSGHGAVDRGELVLCPADTVPKPAAPTKAALNARTARIVQVITERGRANPGRTPIYDAAAKLLGATAAEAAKKGILLELLDVVEHITVEQMGVRYVDQVVLDLLKFVQRNVRRIPSRVGLAPAQLGRVLTPVHFMLALGEHDRRVTLVLDACHSGGPGGALQGSMSGHGWTAAGLGCRILSASEGAQLAAEARIGDRRFSAATWALTQVLSRWQRVEDGPAYALGLRNGELVHRANQLLSALSFRQQISLHAPAGAQTSASDMPFFGLDPATRTVCDPDAASDGIQLSSDIPNLTAWVVWQNGVRKATLLAVGGDAPDWTYAGRTYTGNRLYVFSSPACVQALASNPFNLSMHVWNGIGQPPAPFVDALAPFDNAPLTSVLASGDPGEVGYGNGPPNPSGVFSFQRTGQTKRVFLRWLAPYNGDNGKLHFVSKQAFPFTPQDFDGAGPMSFTAVSSPGFDSSCVQHLITL